MTPKNENNFLVEITPEVMDELNRIYMHSDDEPIAELHYSPYWKRNKDTTPGIAHCPECKQIQLHAIGCKWFGSGYGPQSVPTNKEDTRHA